METLLIHGPWLLTHCSGVSIKSTPLKISARTDANRKSLASERIIKYWGFRRPEINPSQGLPLRGKELGYLQNWVSYLGPELVREAKWVPWLLFHSHPKSLSLTPRRYCFSFSSRCWTIYLWIPNDPIAKYISVLPHILFLEIVYKKVFLSVAQGSPVLESHWGRDLLKDSDSELSQN